MLPVKAICDRRERKVGNQICIQYCFSSEKRTVLGTEIYVPMKYWHKKLSRIKPEMPLEYGDYRILNGQIGRMLRNVEDLISLAEKNGKDPIEFVKRQFKPDMHIDQVRITETADNDINFYNEIEAYIEVKTKRTSKDMPRIYRNMRDHLKKFEAFRKKPITFDCLTLTFYEEFVEFLMYHYVQKGRYPGTVGLKTNTVGKTIKQLRTFLRDRIRKRIIQPIDMTGWVILEEEVDAIYLNWSEIAKLYKVNLKEYPHLEDYRNDFILGCLTGLRFSDLTKLEEIDLRNGMLYKKQQKSEHWVVIPLKAEALEILQNRFAKEIPAPTNAEFNRHIKTVGKLAGLNQTIKHSHKKGKKEIVESKPKYAWITSHTCRRSFCTNEFLAGTPVELIMKISGHKSVKDFYKYIRILPEEAGRKMQELWAARGDQSILSRQ
jgi:site-specific recombinase XerD